MRSPQAAVLAGGSTPATPATPKESRGAARQAFERFDADRSGTLSKDECLAFIDDTGFYGITRGYLDGVWSVYDRNADGALDFKEFSTFYTVLAQRSQKRQTQAPAPEPEPEPSSGAEPAGQAHGDKFPNPIIPLPSLTVYWYRMCGRLCMRTTIAYMSQRPRTPR